METPPATPTELDALAERIQGWLEELQAGNPLIEDVTRDDTGPRRWFVRLAGEQRDHTTVWLHLRQRSLHHETYVLPAPVDEPGRFYEHLLRRNLRLRGLAFAIGEEDAAYLVGEVPVSTLDLDEIDRLLGLHHEAVELCFRPALRLGFASLLS
ncbi:MAG TPA: YbjN domain-containing protein [Acidimicrobiales bacterium]|nr:YbjN domain-containing protein [Acidimicrobiales bacterium]